MRICLIAEGCYPYVAGGVSSWIQMLMQGMPEHTFVIYTIGAEESQRGSFKYELPANVERVEENFLDEYLSAKAGRRQRFDLAPRERQALLDLITTSHPDWNTLFDMFARDGSYRANEFLTSEAFLDIVMEACEGAFRLAPFNDVFWTIRSMLLPVLNILRCPVPDVDVFHAVSTGYAGLLGALFQSRTGRPLVITEHGIYSREREEEILRAKWVDVYFKRTWIDFFQGMAACAYGHADTIVSLFHHARDLQIEYGADPARCRVIPNGIDLARFSDIDELPGERDGLVLGAVVRVVAIKDLKTMINAFAQIRTARPDAVLYIIGPTDEDPEYYRECLDLIDTLGVRGIEFAGRVDVAAWYGRLDMVLLSSISEGQPFVVLEAMASGRPVVATDVGSCRELLEGAGDDDLGDAGAIVPVMSPDVMAQTVLELAGDRERMRRMGAVGRERASRLYRKEDFLSHYRDLYQEVNGRWQASDSN